jgi:hypothetical protein
VPSPRRSNKLLDDFDCRFNAQGETQRANFGRDAVRLIVLAVLMRFAAVVKGALSVEENLSRAPGLATVEQKTYYRCSVPATLKTQVNGEVFWDKDVLGCAHADMAVFVKSTKPMATPSVFIM